MTRVPTIRKADLDRVFKALADCGQRAASVIIRPGGDVVITPGPARSDTLTTSHLESTPKGDEATDLDTFRELKRGRREAQGT